MSILLYMLKNVISSSYTAKVFRTIASDTTKKPLSPRMKEFREKLKQQPISVPTTLTSDVHPDQDKNPFASFPDDTNPNTGEVNGPKGPEPTRYGDWERKGRFPLSIHLLIAEFFSWAIKNVEEEKFIIGKVLV